MHFLIDSDDEAERCRQSFEGHRPITAMTGFDPLTGRINSYSGVVLEVQPIQSLGDHWRITIDTGNASERREPASALLGNPWGVNRRRVSNVLAGVR
jgi:hypothetical protein